MKNTLYQSFTGEYNNSLDGKNRLNIPAKFRKALDPVNDKTFVITRGFDACIVLYPLYQWNKVEKELASLSSIRNMNRKFVRSIVRFASYVQYDKQGRVVVPENLKKFASIDRDVIIIGMINKIEIWNPSTIDDEDNIANDSFDELANDISF